MSYQDHESRYQYNRTHNIHVPISSKCLHDYIIDDREVLPGKVMNVCDKLVRIETGMEKGPLIQVPAKAPYTNTMAR